MNLLRQVFKLFDDGKLVDCTGIVRVGLFLKMFDEGGLIVDKLASKDNHILFESIFEVCMGNGCQVHGIDVWCVYSFGLNLFFKDFFDIKYYMRWLWCISQMRAIQDMTTDELMVRVTFIDRHYREFEYWLRKRREAVAEMKNRSVCVIYE